MSEWLAGLKTARRLARPSVEPSFIAHEADGQIEAEGVDRQGDGFGMELSFGEKIEVPVHQNKGTLAQYEDEQLAGLVGG